MTRQRVDVEELVRWALVDQGLGWVGKDRPACEDWTDRGTIIDDDHPGSHPMISLLTDDDAPIVKAAIDGLPREAAALVIQFGRAGLRPDWAEEGVGEMRQMIDAQGRLLWIWDNPGNRSTKRGGRRPRMEFVGRRREDVEWERAQYLLWWQGLADIVGPLNMRLQGHYAVGPAAPREPWLAAKRNIILPDGAVEVEQLGKVRAGGVVEAEVAELEAVAGRRAEARVRMVREVPSRWGTADAPTVPLGEKLEVVYGGSGTASESAGLGTSDGRS